MLPHTRCLLVVLAAAIAGCRHAPPAVPDDLRLSGYDDEPYAQVLHGSVRDGLVDYRVIGSHYEQSLNVYLDALSRFGPFSTPESFPDRDAKLAYYLNAYNAFVIRRWLMAGAPPGAKVDVSWFHFDHWAMDGSHCTLDRLENRIIRPRFEDPRIHFALVCGAMSCPPLLEEPFDAARLDEQLDGLGRRWLSEPDGLAVRDDGTVVMSAIFVWYRKDFDAMGGLEGVIERYLDDGDPRKAPALQAARDGTIESRGYDWSINQAR